MIIVSDVVSLQQRGKYQGLLGISIALGSGIGPVLGGICEHSPCNTYTRTNNCIVSSHASWRWVFWITPPMTAVSVVNLFFKISDRIADYYGRDIIPTTSQAGTWLCRLEDQTDRLDGILSLSRRYRHCLNTHQWRRQHLRLELPDSHHHDHRRVFDPHSLSVCRSLACKTPSVAPIHVSAVYDPGLR
jgi:hypothetical protein